MKAAAAKESVLHRMNKLWRALVSFVFSVFLGSSLTGLCYADSLHIAVASNFKPTLEEIIALYEQQNAASITLSSASTGVLAAQIRQGAPFDLLFAADAKIPKQLAETLNLAKPVTYAIGSLAFWCPQGAPKTPAELAQWRSDVAIAASQHAPYGRAAETVIEQLNWPTSTRLVTATNIAQVSLFVSTQAVSCGFVARSLLADNTPAKQVFNIPAHWHSTIEQQALVLNTEQKVAYDFLIFVLTTAQSILIKDGYLVSGP